MQVLVVEDDRNLRRFLSKALREEGYGTVEVESGDRALDRALDASYSCIILDVMLPGRDGFHVVTELRSRRVFTPVLMLTAKDELESRVRGLEAGADDYLTKPFDLAILIARIRGLLRRRNWLQPAATPSAAPRKPADVFTFGAAGDKWVNFDSLELWVRSQVFRLTLMEANLLRFMIEHEGTPVSRKNMLQKVWSLQEDTDTRPIDNFIVRLRRYLEDDPKVPKHLITVRGVGYQFVAVPA